MAEYIRDLEAKSWSQGRGKKVTLPSLHPSIQVVIREWFELVDENGSGTLDKQELTAALKVRCLHEPLFIVLPHPLLCSFPFLLGGAGGRGAHARCSPRRYAPRQI